MLWLYGSKEKTTNIRETSLANEQDKQKEKRLFFGEREENKNEI